MYSSYKSLAALLVSTALLLGCSEKKDPQIDELSNRIGPDYQGPSEPIYCDDIQSFSNSVTISGSAKFVVRKVIPTGINAGLGDPDDGNPKPIRYAEIKVLDSSDAVVQCGETDTNGDYSLSLPKGSESLRVFIMARALNSKLKVSVLDAPEKNNVYKIGRTVTADSNKTINITAKATGTIAGGAFNIYDQILNVNDYIRSEVSASFVASKVQAYWTPGFNPGAYVQTNSLLSFYYPGSDRLFVLGGDDGNTDNTDTDHFDNSIIIHEYGHFLEDNYAVSNSPGGSHSGTRQIDARLAWSEGFANFLNAAVKTYVSGDANDATYVDTYGNSSGNTGLGININIESYDGCINLQPGCDRATETGEAIFREFAISRYLYDAVDNTPSEKDNLGFWNASANSPSLADGTGRKGDTYEVSVAGTVDLGSGNVTYLNGDSIYYDGSVWQKNAADADFDNVSGMFSEIWAALKSSSGFKSANTSFRDAGLLNLVEQEAGGTSWERLRISHGFPDDISNTRELRREYGYLIDTVANGASSCSGFNYSIDPKSESEEYQTSNLFKNNDFFYIQHGGGNLTVTLKYKTASVPEANLDLLVYFDEGPFGYSYVRSSDGIQFPYISASYPDGTSGDTETESINLGTQPAGDYLINVYALGGNGNATTFELRSGSGKLCPKNVSL